MSGSTSYYRIDDPETLKKIEAYFDKRSAFQDQVSTLCEKYGVEHYSSFDSSLHGLEFRVLLAHKDQEIDLSKWKTSKHKNRNFVEIRPRRSNKEFCAEYDALVPQTVPSDELNKLIIDDQDAYLITYGYAHKPGHPFYFETRHKTTAVAVEVLASEYQSEFKTRNDDE